MMIVLTGSKTLTVETTSAPTTQPQAVAAYADATDSNLTEGGNEVTLTGTTPVTLVAAPAASTRRIIKGVWITNRDSVDHTVAVKVNGVEMMRRLVATGTTMDVMTGLNAPEAAVAVHVASKHTTTSILTDAGLLGLATLGIVGTLSLAKLGTTARTATFPDAAITVAGINLAQTWTATQSFAAVNCTVLTASGVLDVIHSTAGNNAALLRNTSATGYGPVFRGGGGGGLYCALFQDYNGTQMMRLSETGTLAVTAGVTCTTLTASSSIGLSANVPAAYVALGITNSAANGYAQVNLNSGTLSGALNVATGLFYKFYHNGTVPWQWESSSGVVATLTSTGALTTSAGITCTTLTAVAAGINSTFDSGAASDARMEFKRNGVRQGLFSWDTASLTFEGDVAAGSSILFRAGGAQRYSLTNTGLHTFAGGAAPGTPGSTDVLIGAGQIKTGAGITCTTLTASGSSGFLTHFYDGTKYIDIRATATTSELVSYTSGVGYRPMNFSATSFGFNAGITCTTLTASSATVPSSPTTGALIVAGGIGVASGLTGVGIYMGSAAAGSASIESGYGNLIRHRQYGYPGYYAVQIGDTARGIGLGIDPTSIAGGAFNGTALDFFFRRGVVFRTPNSGSTDWAPAIRIVGGQDSTADANTPLTINGGVIEFLGSAPGTPTSTQVLIGAGQIKTGAGITAAGITVTSGATLLATTTTPASGSTGVSPWVSGSVSLVSLVSSGAAADEKIWDVRHTGTTFQIRAAADNYSASNTGFAMSRSGSTISGIGFFGATPVAKPSMAAATGTATRTTFDTTTVTTAQLAERVKALIDDLRAYGLEG
jgi:hypothetical protein